MLTLVYLHQTILLPQTDKIASKAMYIDGETLNIINGRVVPDEDPGGRVEANAIRLFGLLTGASADYEHGDRRVRPPEPRLIFGPG